MIVKKIVLQDHEGKVWNQAAAYKWKLMGLIGFRMLRNFSLDIRAGVVTDISESGARRLIREVLCPEFNIFPPVGFDTELKHMVFHRMLDEQAGILNFLSEQRTAVINGAAGTGKTLIAQIGENYMRTIDLCCGIGGIRIGFELAVLSAIIYNQCLLTVQGINFAIHTRQFLCRFSPSGGNLVAAKTCQFLF